MNYLAHSVLSFQSEEVLLGQFIADDIKGKQWQNYPKAIQHGILLHRFIDDYTDNHELVLDLKALIRPQLGKYAGVALDVLFDHVLSQRWELHISKNRSAAIQGFYDILLVNELHLSEKRRFIMRKMIEHDWMNMYHSQQGTQQILQQMSMRVQHPNKLHLAMESFILYENDIISTFDVFFQQLHTATRNKLDTFAT